MTDKEKLRKYESLIDRLYYAVEHSLSLYEVDEWSNVIDVLEHEVEHRAVHLLNKYVDAYNADRGTDYDWDWMSYEATEENRNLFEDMLAFATKKEGEHHENS